MKFLFVSILWHFCKHFWSFFLNVCLNICIRTTFVSEEVGNWILWNWSSWKVWDTICVQASKLRSNVEALQLWRERLPHYMCCSSEEKKLLPCNCCSSKGRGILAVGSKGLPQRHTEENKPRDLLGKTKESGCLSLGKKQQKTEEETGFP